MTPQSVVFPVAHTQRCVGVALSNLNSVHADLTLSERCTRQVVFFCFGEGLEVKLGQFLLSARDWGL